MKKLLTILIITLSITAFAQDCKTYALHYDINQSKEFLTSLDPNTGEVTLLDSIPGVEVIQHGFSAINSGSGLFYFHGIDANYNGKLYSLSLMDGSVQNAIDFPPSGITGNIIEMHYHPFKRLIYALHWDDMEQMEYLISINPQTGELIKIDSIPEVYLIQSDFSALNYKNNEYSFIGVDYENNYRLFTLDVNSGNILYQPITPSNNINGGLNELEINSIRGTLHSLHYDQVDNKEYFVNINKETGEVTKLDSIPGVQYIQSGFSAINPQNGEYYFHGINQNNLGFIYTINIYSGETLNQVPISSNISGGLNELQFPAIQTVALNMSQTSICENDSSLVLAPDNFESYFWSNGSTEDHIYVSDSTEYSLILTKDYGCEVIVRPLALSIYNCDSFIDSLINIHDSCWIDGATINMVFTDQVTINENDISVRWNFVTNSADTMRLIDHYEPSANGLYDIGIGFNCDDKSETNYYHSMVEINHMNPTSIDSEFISTNFKLYPNPAKDYIIIDGYLEETSILEIYNINKQLIKTSKLSKSNRIDISELEKGVYLALLRNMADSKAYKIIKQ